VLLVKVKVPVRIMIIILGGHKHHHLVVAFSALLRSSCSVHLSRVITYDALLQALARLEIAKEWRESLMVSRDASFLKLFMGSHGIRVTVDPVYQGLTPGSPGVWTFSSRQGEALYLEPLFYREAWFRVHVFSRCFFLASL
jgi:hypothetical protein